MTRGRLFWPAAALASLAAALLLDRSGLLATPAESLTIAVLVLLGAATVRALVRARAVERRLALLKSAVESSSDGILCVDERGTIRSANPASARLFGRAEPALLGSSLAEHVPDFARDVDAGLAPLAGTILERTVRTKSSRELPVEIALSKAASGLYTAIIRDVSERQARERTLAHQATHDPLTALPNRTALMAHLDALLADPARADGVALLMLDLSRFKEVNDTLGHEVGDEVLREVARRFASELDARAMISRIGGDEFTVVLADVAGHDALDELSRRLIESLRRPIEIRGIAIEVGVSIGIAIARGDSQSAKELLRHADVAMYVSKRQATPFEYYDPDDDQHTARRLGILSELRAAIDGGGITLHYQPLVDLRTGKVRSFEALVRWHHATHGSVGPAEFVTLAEATDLIRPLTEWTIGRALADIAAWRREGFEFRVALNLSARVLHDLAFAARLKALLAESSVEPHRIELEITESAMMLDPERARLAVKELNALGTPISVDDYGTGFSSLGYLRDLRIRSLKLDKSFVVDLEHREQNRVIVQSTVQMAHALGLEVVAEGVESEWTRDYLTSVGYDVGQGYFFARPMGADDCCGWARHFNGEAFPQERRARDGRAVR